MPESEDQSNESNSTEIQRLGKLEPVAQLPFPERWEFDIRAGPDSGEAEFTYTRSTHPDFEARKVGDETTIRVTNQGKTYEIDSQYLDRRVWTDDVWRITQALEDCYFCALDDYQGHDGECQTLFEVVEEKIETKRMNTVLKRIDNVGESVADTVSNRFKSAYELRTATDDELMTIPYVGPNIAQRIRKKAEEDVDH